MGNHVIKPNTGWRGGCITAKMSAKVAKISLVVLSANISEYEILLLEEMVTSDECISYLKIGDTQFKRVGTIVHIWTSIGRIWVTNVLTVLSYVSRFKMDKNVNLDVIIFLEKSDHVCEEAEIIANRFYLGRKDNLNLTRQFIEDDNKHYLELDKISLIKILDEPQLHVWVKGNGIAMAIHTSAMDYYMQDFDKKLKMDEDGNGWMFEPCCFRENNPLG